MEDLILCEETGCCISESVVDNNWLQILAQRKFHWVMMLLLVCNNRLTDRSCILKNGQRKSMKIVKIIFVSYKIWSKVHFFKQVFCKAQKIWKNLPIVLTLLGKNSCFVKTGGRFFSNFVAFSQFLDFNTKCSLQ